MTDSIIKKSLEEVKAHLCSLRDRVLMFKFEDFTNNPEQYLKNMLQFCGLRVNGMIINNAINSIKPDRAYAYKKNAESNNFANIMHDRLS